MTPIIAVFMSMISLLALVADRANLQEQGDAIPLPSVDDGVSRNFLDVAKRTLPLKMTPARTINLRRVPRSAAHRVARSDAPGPAPELLDLQDDLLDDATILLQSLIIHALRKRDVREQLFGERSTTTSTSTRRPRADPRPTRAPRPSPAPGSPWAKASPKAPKNPKTPNSLGELRDNLMVHGRDRDLLRRRWKIENAGNRVANIHG